MRGKRRLTPFDLLVFFLILSLGILLFGHAMRPRERLPEGEVTLTFRVKGVDPHYADAIEREEHLVLDGFPLTRLSSRREAARLPTPDGSGSFLSHLTCDLFLEYRATGSVSEDGFALGGKRALSPGMSLSLSSPDLIFEAVLWRIQADEVGQSHLFSPSSLIFSSSFHNYFIKNY